jgi:hypothetical protein
MSTSVMTLTMATRQRRKQKTGNGKFYKFDKNKHRLKKPLTTRSYSNNEWKAMEDNDKEKVKTLSDAKKSLLADARKTSSVMSDHTDKDPPNEVPQKATTPVGETKDEDEGAGGQFGCYTHMSKKQ